MYIAPYREPLAILEALNYCHTPTPATASPNRLAYAQMSRDELGYLCGLIQTFRPSTLVELGVSGGGTTAVMLNALSLLRQPCTVVSIDCNQQCYWDASKPVGFVLDDALPLLSLDQIQHKLYRGNRLPQILPMLERKVDLLVLDTSHRLPGELLDFMAAFPYLSENAVVAVDDLYTPHYHVFPPYSEPEAAQQTASFLLYTLMDGEELTFYDAPCKPLNLGAKQRPTIACLERCMTALSLPWVDMPGSPVVELYRAIFREQYDQHLLALFERAVTLNQHSFAMRTK